MMILRSKEGDKILDLDHRRLAMKGGKTVCGYLAK